MLIGPDIGSAAYVIIGQTNYHFAGVDKNGVRDRTKI